nr:hypothetical protein [Tanacetum cinerariifolium]
MEMESQSLVASVKAHYTMDFVHFALRELEIHSLMIQLCILTMILQSLSTYHHSPRHTPEIPEVIPFIKGKEWIERKNELYKIMEAYTKRMNQQHEHEALLGAQREQELLTQKHIPQEKEEPPQNSDFPQLIREMCGIKASAKQKQNIEDTML